MNVTRRDTLNLPKRKSRKVKLVADATFLPLLQQYLQNEISYARQHEKGIIRDDDTEFLHQYRVALRRVRALLKLLKPFCPNKEQQAITEQLKQFMHRTNALRDLDVYLMKMDDYFDYLDHPHHQGLARFFDDIQDVRKASFKDLKRWLKSEDYQAQWDELLPILNQPWQQKAEKSKEKPLCLPIAKQVLNKSQTQVCQRILSIDNKSEDAVIHQLRIDCKKLRYSLEYFAPLLHQATVKTHLKHLKVLQDKLGDFNDSAVQQSFLNTYRNNKKPNSHRYRAVSELITLTEQQHLASKADILGQISQVNTYLATKGERLFR